MSVYLHDVPLPEAQSRVESALRAANLWGLLGIERIQLDENATSRVLAEPVWARISSPHYHAAAMDGFAVRSSETAGALLTSPRSLIYKTQTVYVDTGDPLPPLFDAVIPIENVEPLDEAGEPAPDLRRPHAIRIRAAIAPWSHIRTMGEDMVATQLVLPAGHSLRPVDLGAIAACGHDSVRVARQPRVAILPTGDELVPIGKPVREGEIIEYNSLVLAAQVNSWGGESDRFPISSDDLDEICNKVKEAAKDHDLILLNAGSSAGSEDFSAQVIESLGKLLVHGIAVRPGHPVIFGMIHRPGSTAEIPIIGVPGYPVSAALTGEIFVEPLLARWLGRQPLKAATITATLTRKTTSPGGDDDFIRVAVGKVGERLLAAPLARGAGVITSLVRADGLVVFPRGSQGLSAGEQVEVHLYRSHTEIENTIFTIGSHDITLDILAQFLATRNRRFSSANVGSLAGLVALRRGEAHLAGSHLFDPNTREYNLPYIRQYLPGMPVTVMALVGRKQGLLVKKGNPKGIQALNDLTRTDIIFVNRQRGAGTRVLLDYQLESLGISTNDVQGYGQEEYTHLAIAAAVASGRADCGLGIAAAAKALDLDFVPLFDERYDLVIPRVYYESDLLVPLLDVLHDTDFRNTVDGLPGYDISIMGDLIAELY